MEALLRNIGECRPDFVRRAINLKKHMQQLLSSKNGGDIEMEGDDEDGVDAMKLFARPGGGERPATKT
eukprot:8744732-Pyramimonas_sp.AAC.1